jgi:hypothetical protein
VITAPTLRLDLAADAQPWSARRRTHAAPADPRSVRALTSHRRERERQVAPLLAHLRELVASAVTLRLTPRAI